MIDSVEQYIAKFKTHITTVITQQDPMAKYKNNKFNQLFLITLKYFNITDKK